MGSSGLYKRLHKDLKWVVSSVPRGRVPAQSSEPTLSTARALLSSGPSIIPRGMAISREWLRISSTIPVVAPLLPLCTSVTHTDTRPGRSCSFAAEGVHTGQFIYCGKKAQLTVGNVMPIGQMPEGTIISNLEEKTGDRGRIARASGNYAIVIAHNPDTKRTRVKLPSGT